MTPHAVDVAYLLQFFPKLYAHALTIQDLMATDDERKYEDVRPKYDQQASEQFELFYRALNQPEAFSAAVKDFLDTHPEP
jgi:hypothetical protein